MLGTATFTAVMSSSAIPRPKLVAMSVQRAAAALLATGPLLSSSTVRMMAADIGDLPRTLHGCLAPCGRSAHLCPGSMQECMPMADWSDLRYFLELSRSRTLAAASRKLRVDYTTVGRRLAALERDLGAKLFERTPEGLVLTEAGEGIRAAAEGMEEAALLVEQRALGADRKLAGVVRVATTEMLGQAVVLPAVR